MNNLRTSGLWEWRLFRGAACLLLVSLFLAYARGQSAGIAESVSLTEFANAPLAAGSFLPEPEQNPPVECRLDSPHLGGIDIVEAGVCLACCDFGGLSADTGVSFAKGDSASVYLHSGEAFAYAIDLEIPGRGFNWQFARKYRSGSTNDGPLGSKWDFNYNRYLQLLEGGNIERADGHGRYDTFVNDGNGNYQSPAGFYTRLTQRSDGSFVERDYRGVTAVYDSPNGQGVARLLSLSDRNANMMTFDYNQAGQLERVWDTMGRPITYTYNVDGRLDAITDFTGRKVSYTYDSAGNLTDVTSPTVTGTPTDNDFPNGKTTSYAYDPGHLLTSITAPNEVDNGGPPRVQIQYGPTGQVAFLTIGGTNNSGIPAGGTVSYTYLPGETQVIDRNGNRTDYAFNALGNIISVREHTNRAIRPGEPGFYETTYAYNGDGKLVQKTYPEGNFVKYSYDELNADRLQQGNLLAEIRHADQDRAGDHSVITITWSYEPLYNQVRAKTEARGNDPAYLPQNGGLASPERYKLVYTFDFEEACDFTAIGTRVGRSATQTQQRLNSAGMCAGPLGDVNSDGLTSQISGNTIRSQWPTVALLAESRQAALEGDTAQEIVSLTTFNHLGQPLTDTDPESNVKVYDYYSEQDPNGDGLIDNPGGDALTGGYLKQLTVDTVGDPLRNSGTDPALVLGQRLYKYDPVGNLIREVDGRGIATDYVVNELNQAVQVSRAAAHELYPPEPAEPLPLIDFQYLERNIYDANDNVVVHQVEDRGDTSQVGGDNTASGSAFVDLFYTYDILDNLVRQTEEVSDTLDLVTSYRYDANLNPVLTIFPAGNASASTFDERDLLFQQTRGAISPPPQALLAPGDPTNYDARSGVPSTTTYHYDGNRNLVEWVDAADTDGSGANNSTIFGDGDRTRFLYDGFDRRTSVVDSLGNQTVSQYDPAGNVVRILNFGPVGGPSPTGDGPDLLPAPVSSAGVVQAANLVNDNLLSASEYRYDELSRAFQEDALLFANTIPTARPPDVADGAADIGKGDLTPNDDQPIPGIGGVTILGRVSVRTEYDHKSRPTFRIDDDGDVSRSFYDGADRVIREQDPEGNQIEMAYDDNGNVIEVRETDVAQVPGVADEVFLTSYFYDSLNRQQQTVDNLGQAIYFRYDSRDNLVATADAQGPLTGAFISRRAFPSGPKTVNGINDFGNVMRYDYDGLSRRIREEIVLMATGAGDGLQIGATLEGVKKATPPADPAQGGGDGRITLLRVYDANSLLASQTDDNGNQTRYTYDNLDRRLTETRGICVPPALADRCDPPTTITYTYDPDDNVIGVTDENGTTVVATYDALNRLIAEDVTRAPGIVGTTAASYEYDGLSRMTRATDNNEPGDPDDDSAMTYAYDSLSRTLEQTQQIGSLPAGAVSSAWRGTGLRSGLTYPNGRFLSYTYDRLDRIQTINGRQPLTSVYLPLILKSGPGQSPSGSAAAASGSAPAVSPPLPSPGPAEVLAAYRYIGPGRVLERSYSNGVRLTYLDDAGKADVGYDGLRQPGQLRHLRADNSLVVGFSHTFDRMNNKQGEAKLHDPANGETYGYDSAYRLTQFDRPDPGAIAPLYSDWMLDGAGNWQQVDGEVRQHSSFNEITMRDDGTPTIVFSDDNGNETDDGTFTFVWDYKNRLRAVTRKSDGARIAAYAYDASNRRIRKTVTNPGNLDGTTDFYYDGWQVIEERDGADGLRQQVVYGIHVDEPLILDRNLDGDDTATGPKDQRLFYHQNTLYSVFALTNTRGNILEGYQYDAYGRQTLFTPGNNGKIDFGDDDVITPGGASGVDNAYTFTGRRFDAETGLYYYRQRYLNADQGRFIHGDPIGPWADIRNVGNGYAYAANNPANLVDPLGLASLEVIYWLKGTEENSLLWLNYDWVDTGQARVVIDLAVNKDAVNWRHAQDVSNNTEAYVVIRRYSALGGVYWHTEGTIDHAAGAVKLADDVCCDEQRKSKGIEVMVNFMSQSGAITANEKASLGVSYGGASGSLESGASRSNVGFKVKPSVKLRICPDGKGDYTVAVQGVFGNGIDQSPATGGHTNEWELFHRVDGSQWFASQWWYWKK